MDKSHIKYCRYGAVDRYLHALLLLTNRGQQADTGDLAEKLGVSDPAASRMLKSLARQKLVKLEPYEGAELTTAGLHRALRVIRRHRLLELYLHRVLGFALDEVHERATGIQPVLDEAFEEKLDIALGHPKIDPHGEPIPSKDATWPRLSDAMLLELPPGTTGSVSRIMTDDSDVMNYLAGIGLKRGAAVAFEHVAPFEGPVTLRLGGKGVVHLGRRLAQLIFLQPDKDVKVVTRSREKSHKHRTARAHPSKIIEIKQVA